jgi:protein-S-isoprenylcysteine O-methyltransferase Ste14
VALITWAGALLFLVSLSYFLYSYVVTYGEVVADTGGSVRAITWNVIVFTIFALHHSVFARERVRAWMMRQVRPELERSVYVWIASALFIVVCALWLPVAGVAWGIEGPGIWAMRGLQAAGVWLSLHSAVIIDIRELAGIWKPDKARPTEFNTTGINTEFKTVGAYGWVRHPIYSGWFLIVWAAPLMTMTRLVFAVISCAYLLIAIPFEERSLRASSAGAYDRYAATVRWKLMPGIY